MHSKISSEYILRSRHEHSAYVRVYYQGPSRTPVNGVPESQRIVLVLRGRDAMVIPHFAQDEVRLFAIQMRDSELILALASQSAAGSGFGAFVQTQRSRLGHIQAGRATGEWIVKMKKTSERHHRNVSQGNRNHTLQNRPLFL